ncbi:MAG: radical SAM protein [Arthrospira platensis PCC 7345]|nr:radical SAM protein [Arthrospira platensis PCC 7345]
MKYLLLNPNWNQHTTPFAVDTVHPPIAPPLEFAYISSALKDLGEIRICDAYAANYSNQDILNFVDSFQPDWIILTTTPSLLYWRCPPLDLRVPSSISKFLQTNNYNRILAIGPHSTVSPEWTNKKLGNVFVTNGLPGKKVLEIIKQSNYDSNDKILYQDPKIFLDNDDKADFSCFDFSLNYIPHMWNVDDVDLSSLGKFSPSLLMETSKGCPYHCGYCFKSPLRDKFQRRNILSIQKELEQAKSLGVEYVFFIDEIFNLPDPGFLPTLDCIAQFDIKFGFQGRPDLITKEIAQYLSNAGCVYVELGFDAASTDISSNIKRTQKFEKAKEGLDICHEFIPIVRYNRLNLSTWDYSVRLKIADYSDNWDYPADPVYPYPNTDIGDKLMKLYGYQEYSWEFAERYVRWLRIEVGLQRDNTYLQEMNTDIPTLQEKFLQMDENSMVELCKSLRDFETDYSFHISNRLIKGE